MLVDRGQTHRADGGEGGQKGAPGAGGKVYRATIDVVPGQVIHYECGTPGVGGATNGAVGAAGGETTSGIYRLHRGPRLRSDTWTR